QPSGQVREVFLEGLPVGPPPLTVDPGRGVSLQRVVRRPQVLDVVDVVQERREPHLLVPLSSFTYPCPRTQRAVPAQCPGRVLRWRRPGCGLPPTPTASASRREALSRLNTRPARTPVNASRTAAHDSGPVWVARPSPYDSLIRNTSPV